MLAVLRRVVPADAVAFAAFPEGDVNGESWSTADTTITTTAIFSSIHIRFFLFFGGGGGGGGIIQPTIGQCRLDPAFFVWTRFGRHPSVSGCFIGPLRPEKKMSRVALQVKKKTNNNGSRFVIGDFLPRRCGAETEREREKIRPTRS